MSTHQFSDIHIRVSYNDETSPGTPPFALYMKRTDPGEGWGHWNFAGNYASMDEASEAAYTDYAFTLSTENEDRDDA